MTALTYAECRSLVKSGDLMFTSHFSWSTWRDFEIQAVRTFTQSEYSHVGLIWAVGGRLFVIEAVKPFVRMVPLSRFADDGFYWVPLATDISPDELEFALSRVGKSKYSKWQAVLAYLKMLKIGADELVSCAEFIITCRRLSGLNLGQIATPAAVARSCAGPVWPVKNANEKAL